MINHPPRSDMGVHGRTTRQHFLKTFEDCTMFRKVRGQCEPRVQCEPRMKFDYAFPASAAADAGLEYFSALAASAENMRHRLRMRISSAVHDEPPRFTLTPHLPTMATDFGLLDDELIRLIARTGTITGAKIAEVRCVLHFAS